MKNFARLLGTVLALCCCGVGAAKADMKDIYAANNSANMDIGFQRQKYGETVGGLSFDYEKGTLPNLGFGLVYMPHSKYSSWWLRNIYMSLQGNFGLGNTDYTGGLCSASGCIPWTSTTENTILSFALRLGHGFPVGHQVMLIPYGDLGFRSWERKLTGIGGYTETYQHGTIMAGLLTEYSPAERWVLGLGVEGGTTIAASMKTGGYNYNLAARPAWQFETRAGYRITKHLEVTAKGDYSGFGYGASPLVGNGSYEPDSYTHNIRATVGVAYQYSP